MVMSRTMPWKPTSSPSTRRGMAVMSSTRLTVSGRATVMWTRFLSPAGSTISGSIDWPGVMGTTTSPSERPSILSSRRPRMMASDWLAYWMLPSRSIS